MNTELLEIRVGEKVFTVEPHRRDAGSVSFTLHSADGTKTPHTVWIKKERIEQNLEPRALEEANSSKAITSPLSGLLSKVFVNPGDFFSVGAPLFVIEAMKMENQITATVSGTVESIAVVIGSELSKGAVVLKLK